MFDFYDKTVIIKTGAFKEASRDKLNQELSLESLTYCRHSQKVAFS